METGNIEQEQNPTQTTDEQQPTLRKILNQKGSTIIVLGIIFLIFIVGAIGYLLLKREDTAIFQSQPNQQNSVAAPVKNDLPRFIYRTDILYWQEGDKTTHIFLFDPNTKQGKEILSIPTTKARNLSRISLSPNGGKIAYSLFEQTVIGTGAPDINRELWLVNSDGSDNKLVFSDKTEGSIFDYLTWSPDSNFLIFYNNSRESYKVSISDGKTEKMPRLPGKISGWFNNNKLGFEQAKPTGCPPENECYPSYKAILTNEDGSQTVEVYDPPKDYDPLTIYSWLKDGSGVVKVDRKTITHFDFATKKETEIIKFAPKETGSLIMFPKTNSAIVSVRSGESITEFVTLYNLDLGTDKLSKIKTYNESADVISVSGDEKYYLIKYGNRLQGNTAYPIEKGLEVYDMNGNLVSGAPFKSNIQPLGFIN